MPNDPRVKFHKGGKICRKDIEYLRKHPECYGFIKHNTAFGGGGGRGEMSSIFEDGTPPPDRPDPINPINPIDPTPRDNPAQPIPQPLKPGLTPGELTGITIGSLVGIAAAAELTRRALEEAQRRRGGEQQVSQDDRPLSSRQSGGKIFERQSRARVGRAISRGINTAIQSSFEMMTPTSGYGPVSIQPTQAYLSALPSEENSEIRAAMDTSMSRPAPAKGIPLQPQETASGAAPRPAPARITDLAQSEFGRGSYELQGRSLIPPITPEEQLRLDLLNESDIHLTPPDTPDTLSSGQRTPPEMSAALDRLDAMANRDAEITLMLANQEISPEIKEQLRKEQIKLNEEFKGLEKLTESEAAKKIQIEAAKAAKSKINQKALTNTQSTLQKLKKNLKPSGRIPKTITQEPPIANNPINDRINAARPTREISGTEMTSPAAHEQRQQTAIETIVESSTPASAGSAAAIERETLISPGGSSNVEVKPRGPTLIERGTAALQRAISRNPATPIVNVEPISKPPAISPAGNAALERARTGPSGLSTDVEVRPVETQAPPMSEAEAFERAIKQSTLEAGLGYTRGEGSGSSKGLTAETLRAEQPTSAPIQETTEVPRVGKGKGKAVAPLETIERPAEVPKLPPPPAPAPVATETAVDRFNKMYDIMAKQHIEHEYKIPTAPEGVTGIDRKKYIMDEILKETIANERPIYQGKNKIEMTLEEATAKVQAEYNKALNDPTTQRPIEAIKPEETIQIAPTKKGKGKGKEKTKILATEEQRLRPTALAREAQARVQARAPAPETTRAPAPETARAAAPEISARAAAAPEMRATAPEIRAPAAPAPEAMSARRQLSAAPELTAPRPVAPEERASFAERRAFFEETSRVAPPAGEIPSPPPSAPASGTSTPQEGPTVERTPVEQASFGEEISAGLKGKKVPGRQKAKLNFGKPANTRNPLDIFVSPQHRNIPSVELHPGAKNLSKSLSELGSRVPKLIPTKAKLISMGTSFAAEGGGMVAGFYAGSEAGKAMSNYFATHPPKNRNEEYGQALATSMVALGVGNLVAKTVTYAIRQGVSYALAGEISGSISSAGAAGGTALGEAALFATVATTTQFYTTKSLEDAGYSHEYARGHGAAYATVALMATEEVAWLAKGGPWNPAADVAFITTELFIIGFGIWSIFEETAAGREQDEAEEANREEIAKQKKERDDAIAVINNTNTLRQNFMLKLAKYNYDFDALYATLSIEQRVAMGIASPEAKAIFQRQVESAFDPFGAFQEPNNGLEAPVVLSEVEQDRRDVFNEYINWYIGELRGVEQPPFNMNDSRVQELNEYSGGTWQSAAGVTASTNYAQSERTHPLIENAQNEIINAFHNERKTIEELPPDVVRYANLDPNFRNTYEAYIVSEAGAQILIEFNRTQFTYNDMDPKLVEIANRDPNFRAAADMYYQTMANQARDLNLSISEVARLNSLMEMDQAVEIGKLNEARNLIISRNQEQNQAAIDSYNANILREINIYGDNFESIIRNINDQALLTGHTFLYGTTPAALYQQLHMEMPELELIDPDDEIDGPDQPDATWHSGKGRKVGDTAIYSYRYNLTDEQNQELDELARREYFITDPEEMKRRAAIIYQRDRYLYEQTDQEKANDLGMTLEEYYAKFGIPIDPATIPIPDFNGTYPTNGRVRMPNGNIETYKDGKRTGVETPEFPYDPTLPQQPNGNIRMPDGSVRTYLDGKVTFVMYPSSTPVADQLTPNQINAGTGISYEQLQQQYPETYKNLLQKYGDDPTGPAQIEATLRKAYNNGFNETTKETNSGLTPGGQPVKPITPEPTREPTYEELKVMYPDKYDLFYNSYIKYGDPATADKNTEIMLRSVYQNNPVPLPVSPTQPTEPTPTSNEPTYQLLQVMYSEEYETLKRQQRAQTGITMEMMNANIEAALREVYLQNPKPLPGQQTQPTIPDGPLKNGYVKMPDGSTRTYRNGLVVQVSYPGTIPTGQQLSPQEINDAEGVRPVSYIGPTTTPETPKESFQQGAVKMPDGSKRIYIDGKVVSVAYPDGTSGPTINEINAAEGVRQADAPSITNTNPMQGVDDLFKGKTPRPTPAKGTPLQPQETASGAAPRAPPEEEVVLGNRLDSLMGRTQAPAPAPATTTNP